MPDLKEELLSVAKNLRLNDATVSARTIEIAAERIAELEAYFARTERYMAAQRALWKMWEADRA